MDVLALQLMRKPRSNGADESKFAYLSGAVAVDWRNKVTALRDGKSAEL